MTLAMLAWVAAALLIAWGWSRFHGGDDDAA